MARNDRGGHRRWRCRVHIGLQGDTGTHLRGRWRRQRTCLDGSCREVGFAEAICRLQACTRANWLTGQHWAGTDTRESISGQSMRNRLTSTGLSPAGWVGRSVWLSGALAARFKSCPIKKFWGKTALSGGWVRWPRSLRFRRSHGASPELLADRDLWKIARRRREALEASRSAPSCEQGYLSVQNPSLDLPFAQARAALLAWISGEATGVGAKI